LVGDRATSVAKFKTSVAKFKTSVAKFETSVAKFKTNVAKFATSVAKFKTNVAKFATDVARTAIKVDKPLRMIELMKTRVVAFPQAVGVAVMKIKSFGLMVAAIETRVWVVGTGVEENIIMMSGL
jgi:ATP-dependent protease HslVU (ClpYQ) peptidase subunit